MHWEESSAQWLLITTNTVHTAWGPIQLTQMLRGYLWPLLFIQKEFTVHACLSLHFSLPNLNSFHKISVAASVSLNVYEEMRRVKRHS